MFILALEGGGRRVPIAALASVRGVGFAVAVLVALLYSVAGWAAVGRTPGIYSVSPGGEATYTVPLFAPPGAAKMSPKLALNYGHRAGGWWLGEGWGISGLSAITRCPKTWAQDGLSREVKLDLTDRYCLDGAQLKSFLLAYGTDGALYRTEIEQYASIESKDVAGVTGGPGYFTVRTKDGLIYDYGTREDSRIQAIGTTKVAVWALTTIRDRSGNRIEFTYLEDSTNGSYQISYVDWSSNPGQSQSAPYRTQFFYDTQPAGEIESGYLMGSGVKDIKRLSRVDVTYNTALVRRYPITYETNLSSTSRSRLATVSECAGASGTDCLAPIAFTYSDGTNGIGSGVVSGATTAAPGATMVMDVNGDGRTDLVYPSTNASGTGVWMVALANTSGSYSTPLSSGIANVNFSRAIPIDYNADGRDDLLFPDGSNVWHVALGNSSGLGSATSLGIAAAGAGSTATALDVDGDGLEDLVELTPDAINGDRINYRLRVLAGTFGSVTAWFGPGPNYYISAFGLGSDVFRRRARAPDFNGDGHGDLLISVTDCTAGITSCFTYYQGLLGGSAGGIIFPYVPAFDDVVFADLNGDRYTDIVSRSGGYWYAWYGAGAGFIGGGSVGPVGTSPYRAVVQDWDHDGYEDILTVGSSGNWFVIRSTGIGLATPADTTVYAGSISAGFAADVNGDDLDDVIYADGGGVLRFHLHSGVKPDLLATATDGYGNVVTFSYQTLAQGSYSKYADAVFPYQDYQGPLYVVSQYAATDGTNGNPNTTYTVSFWYYGAWQHRQGRGFAGFYAMRPYDSRSGIVDYSYFRRDFPYTGMLFHKEPFLSSSISRDVNYYAYFPFDSGAEARYFPYVNEAWHYDWEVGGPFTGVLLRTIQTTAIRDTLSGEVKDQTVVTTEKNGANGLYPNATHTVRTWVSQMVSDTSPSVWCLGRPEIVSVISSHSMPEGTQRTRTSDAIWDYAMCRPMQSRVEPNDSALRVTTALDYDDFGNVDSEAVSALTGVPTGGGSTTTRTTLTNWGTSGQFPHSVQNALSQTSTQTWDFAQGVPLTATDPNGIGVSWQYDSFGRKTREIRADGTYSDILRLACSGCEPRVKTYIKTEHRGVGGALQSNDYDYFDTFDRPVHQYRMTGMGDFQGVSTHYDSQGRKVHESVPYLLYAAPTTYWNTLYYDAVSRPTSVWRYVSSTNTTNQISQTAYEGLTVRTVDEEGKQNWQNKNAIGKVVRTIDHDNYRVGFEYDAFGNPKRVFDSSGATLQSNTYNNSGHKTASNDIDMGGWIYLPNAHGEVESQTDANGKTTTMEYDALGRMKRKNEPAPGGGTIVNEWHWGVTAGAWDIGQLNQVTRSGPGIQPYTEDYVYDNKGRLATTWYLLGTFWTSVDQTYNAVHGGVETVEYPTSTSSYRHKVKYEYDYLKPKRVRECTSGACSSFGVTYWTASAEDARGNITDELLGNGLRTQRTVDVVSGFLGQIRTGPNGGSATSIQNLSYAFDKVGNLTQRQDLNQSLNEIFSYDNRHRLTGSTLNGTANLAMTYFPNGNIETRWETGGPTLTYAYHASKIHAVSTVTGTGVSWTYDYDFVGNVTAKNGNAVTWLASNKPLSISNGSQSSGFEYGPDGNYWKQVATYSNGTETSVYVGGLMEIVSNSATGITAYRHQIKAAGRTVAVYSRGSNSAQNTIYPLQDHLGSTEAITDSAGAVIVRESFAAFGARRGGNWTGVPTTGPGRPADLGGYERDRGWYPARVHAAHDARQHRARAHEWAGVRPCDRAVPEC
jgi:YD repeat-containing protein